MTGPGKGGSVDRAVSSRRDLLKAMLLGGTVEGYSRVDALKMLVAGPVGAEPVPPAAETTSDDGTTDLSGTAESESSPIPVRATESVSVREIAENTSRVSQSPIKITELAEKRGLLNVSLGTDPREGPPFALRELITSQAIQDTGITNKETGGSMWENWVDDHTHPSLTEYEPDDEQDLLDAVIWNAREGNRIRAVGSGHSHSEVAAPDLRFIRLSRYTTQTSDGAGKGLAGLVSSQSHKWNENRDTDNLFRVQAGATIKYLNRELLFHAGKGLLNMGSFDGQTLAGAVNTSTHGTGARLGSLADTVRSVELMAVTKSPAQPDRPLVRKYRIEPEDGLTSREPFEKDVGNHGTTLIQDDDIFHSVVVGYGCMGVAYSYTIEVRDKYILHEHNITGKWNHFKDDIDQWRGPPKRQNAFYDEVPETPRPGNFSVGDLEDVEPTGARHFHFLVNLSQIEATDTDDPRCLLISHRGPWQYASAKGGSKEFDEWPGPPDWWDDDWPPERANRWGQNAIRWIRKESKGGFHPTDSPPFGYPAGVNSRWATSQNNYPFEEEESGPLEGEEENDPTSFMSASYIALRRKREGTRDPEVEPEAPPPAISTEIAVPADQVVKGVEAVFDVVKNSKYTYNVPMGVRFVARGDHALSPEYKGPDDRDVPVAKVEVPFMVRSYTVTKRGVPQRIITQDEMLGHAKSALEAVEERLLDMSRRGELDFARPHMGKTNNVDRARLDQFYEDFDTWQAIHEEFNAFGTFNNGFTRNKGISIDDTG